MYAIGFDPGGAKAFGWAILDLRDREMRVRWAGTTSGARAAFQAVGDVLPEPPVAVGIDAPLFWILDGDRKSDQFVRKVVIGAGGNGGTVNHVNSLRGACLVQGIQVLRLVHARWPRALITEAHPKALVVASSVAQEFSRCIETNVRNEHERDAALAAFSASALANSEPGWIDLMSQESEPYCPGGCLVSYWFPQITV